MIPYVYNILPALFDNPAVLRSDVLQELSVGIVVLAAAGFACQCGPALIEWQNLKALESYWY